MIFLWLIWPIRFAEEITLFDIEMSSREVMASSQYVVKFNSIGEVPVGGWIVVTLPVGAEIIVAGSDACELVGFSGLDSCVAKLNVVKAVVKSSIPADSNVILNVANVLNPLPADIKEISCRTYNPVGDSIDFFTSQITFLPRPLVDVKIEPQSKQSGVINTWVISATLSIEVPIGGSLSVSFPKWDTNIQSPSTEEFVQPEYFCSVSCIYTPGLLVLKFSQATSGSFSFTINKIKNPPSTQPVPGLILYTYSTQGLLQQSPSLFIISNSPGTLTSLDLSLSLPKVNSQSSYQFSFGTSNPMIPSSFLTLTFPNTITITLTEVIDSILGTGNFNFAYDSAKNQIKVYNIVNKVNLGPMPMQFTIKSCVNPKNTKAQVVKVEVGYGDFLSDQAEAIVIVQAGKVVVEAVTAGDPRVNAIGRFRFTLRSEEPIETQNALMVTFPNEFVLVNQKDCMDAIGGAKCAVKANSMYITNVFLDNVGTEHFTFDVNGVQNPRTCKPTGAFVVSVYSDDQFLYLVSTNTDYQFQASPGVLIASIIPVSLITGVTTDYNFQLQISNSLQTNSEISIKFPSEVIVTSSTSVSNFENFPNPPTTSIQPLSIILTNGFTADSFVGSLKFTIKSVTNPSSTKPSSSFEIKTSLYGFLIDSVTNGIIVTMSTPHQLISATIEPKSLVVNDVSDYYIKVDCFNSIGESGVLRVDPGELIKFEAGVSCVFAGNIVKCGDSSGVLVVSIGAVLSGRIEVKISRVRNPLSTQPIAVKITTANGAYLIDSLDVVVTMSTPAPNGNFMLSAGSYYISTKNDYIINYSLNLMPTSIFEISFLYSVAPTSCLVNDFELNCVSNSNSIIVALPSSPNPFGDSYADSYPQSGTITLKGIKNPESKGSYKIQFLTKYSTYIRETSDLIIPITCKSPCSTCMSTPDTCTSCQPTSPFLLDSACLPTCPLGYYSALQNACARCDQSCSTCSISAVSCTSCVKSYLYKSQCLLSCPDQTYPQGNVCQACVAPCSSCVNSTSCISCVAPYQLFQGNCIASCPNDSFVAVAGVCQPCAGCATCAQSTSICTSCLNGLVLSASKCVSACPNGSFEQQGICYPCSSNCLNCLKSSTACLACYPGWNLLNYACVSVCSAGYYYNSQICEPCAQNCQTCSSTGCTSCKSGFLLQSTQCVDSCSSGYYPNLNLCSPCPLQCKECINSTVCMSCSNGYYLYQAGCFEVCVSGTFISGGECVQCKGCPVCDRDKGCLACEEGVYFNGTCGVGCPLGYVNVKGICVGCENCLKCYGTPSNCTQCSADQSLFQTVCIEECPQGYINVNGTCELNTAGLCSVGCTPALLNNSYCDSLCNNAACDFDNSQCSSTPVKTDASYSKSFRPEEEPFVLVSIGGLSLITSSAFSLLTGSSFLYTSLPTLSILESIGTAATFISVLTSDDFKGRKLSSSSDRLQLIKSLIIALWLVNALLNVSIAVFYWNVIRKRDNLHRLWTVQHKWGMGFILAFMGGFSYKAVYLIVARVERVGVLNARFDKEDRFFRVFGFVDCLYLILIGVPVVMLEVTVLLNFSPGAVAFNLAIDSAALSGVSCILCMFSIAVRALCYRIPSKPSKSKGKDTEEANNTIEITEAIHEASKKLENHFNSPKSEVNISSHESISPENTIPTPLSIISQIRVHKQPLRRAHFSFSVNNFIPATIIDPEAVDFSDFQVDLDDMRRLYVKLKGINEKVLIFKDFNPPIVVDEDGEIQEIDVNLGDYTLTSIDLSDPRIGEFKHNIFNTCLRLMRDFAGATVVNPFKIGRTDEEINSERTVKTDYVLEKPLDDWEDSEIEVNRRYRNFNPNSNKIIFRSGTPPKVSCSKIICQHPGIEESSIDSID